MDEAIDRIVILGAGHAGVYAAACLRQHGWSGSILLVNAEKALPYQRPPLSKDWLRGKLPASELELRSAQFYREQNIELRSGVSGNSIDGESRAVKLSDGTHAVFDRLILATGARGRSIDLPERHLDNVFEVRTRGDADRLRTALRHGSRIAIIGGGYIGLEVAATAISLGVAPTIIEREPRLLSRVASREFSQVIEKEHRLRDVRFELGANVIGLRKTGEQADAIMLSSGKVIECDAVIIGVGVTPEDALARQAGLTCSDGVIVDECSRSSDRNIYAIGDCARRSSIYCNGLVRLESVQNAMEQARRAAASICGKQPPKTEVPWFWSDQFKLKLQMAGFVSNARQSVVRAYDGDRVSVFHLSDEGKLVAIEAMNAPSDFMAGKQLISKGSPVVPDRLRDPAAPLREMIQEATV